jgi:uncharacterized protein (TIGR02246 family)
MLRSLVRFGIVLSLPLAAGTCASWGTRSGPAEVIPRILGEQTAAWNKGDVEAFMTAYWDSPDLTFVSGGTVTRGWRPTLERYRRRYPTPEAMGRLTFSDLQVRELAPDAALVLGRFDLARVEPEKPVGGRFTLLFRRIEGKWVIVYDHTSAD